MSDSGISSEAVQRFFYGKQYHQRTLLITFWPKLLSKLFYPLCQEEAEQEVTCKGMYKCCLAYLYSSDHLFLRGLVACRQCTLGASRARGEGNHLRSGSTLCLGR